MLHLALPAVAAGALLTGAPPSAACAPDARCVTAPSAGIAGDLATGGDGTESDVAEATDGAIRIRRGTETAPAEPGEPGDTPSARFVTVPEAMRRAPAVVVGDVIDPAAHRLLLNSRYYGLPPAGDGWVYYVVDRTVFRVDRTTHEVLEDVTNQTNRAF